MQFINVAPNLKFTENYGNLYKLNAVHSNIDSHHTRRKKIPVIENDPETPSIESIKNEAACEIQDTKSL